MGKSAKQKLKSDLVRIQSAEELEESLRKFGFSDEFIREAKERLEEYLTNKPVSHNRDARPMKSLEEVEAYLRETGVSKEEIVQFMQEFQRIQKEHLRRAQQDPKDPPSN